MIYVDNLVNSFIIWRSGNHKMILPLTILEKASDINLPNAMKDFNDIVEHSGSYEITPEGLKILVNKGNQQGLDVMDNILGVIGTFEAGTCFQQKVLQAKLAEVQSMRSFFRFMLFETNLGQELRQFPFEYQTTIMRLLVGGPEERYFNLFLTYKNNAAETVVSELKRDIYKAFRLDDSVRIDDLSHVVEEYAHKKMFEYLKTKLKSQEQVEQFSLVVQKMNALFNEEGGTND